MFCRLESHQSDARVEGRVPLTVEVVIKPLASGRGSVMPSDGELKDLVRSHLEGLVCLPYMDMILHPVLLSKLSTIQGSAMSPVLQANVESISICDSDHSSCPYGTMTLFWQWDLVIFLFQLNEEGPEEDVEEGDGGEGQEGQASMYREYSLPARDFHGLWDSLFYDDDSSMGGGRRGNQAASCGSVNGSNKTPATDNEPKDIPPLIDHQEPRSNGNVKTRLLRYASSALVFSQRGVRQEIVSMNRVVLLHGPPGTGKTSLCLALAQKLSIRFGSRYPAGSQLIEVNAHSLFSKYFSESGKLVGRLFSRITELVEDGGGQTLVFVLIDEVESLTAARKAGGNEPTDALRAVNSLLTQLDQLKRFPNVLVLSTSNLSGAIDAAFLDRADIRAYIGPPSIRVRYNILASALIELERTGIIYASAANETRPLADPAMNHKPGDNDEPMSSCDQVGGEGGGGEGLHGQGKTPNKSSSPPGATKFCDLLLPVDQLLVSPHLNPGPDPVSGNLNLNQGQGPGGGLTGSYGNIDQKLQQHHQALSLLSGTGKVQGGEGQGELNTMDHDQQSDAVTVSRSLWLVASACEGMSCRLLRKLPFLAHASASEMPEPCHVLQFLREMRVAAMREGEERELARES